MTRDEAMAIAKHTDGRLKHTSNSFAEDIVNILIALGMLKLDEPQDASAKFVQAVATIPVGYRTPINVLGALTLAGLKIVEK